MAGMHKYPVHVRVGIALGSNMGDRDIYLDEGITFLRSISIDHQVLESPRFRTSPVDCPPGSEWFLNAVAEIEVDRDKFPPRDLLTQLRDFELACGRPPQRETNAPRSLDLDIIYYGEEMICDPDLVIPHPRAASRRFVLEPLSYLHPDMILSGQAKTIGQLLAECPLCE